MTMSDETRTEILALHHKAALTLDQISAAYPALTRQEIIDLLPAPPPADPKAGLAPRPAQGPSGPSIESMAHRQAHPRRDGAANVSCSLSLPLATRSLLDQFVEIFREWNSADIPNPNDLSAQRWPQSRAQVLTWGFELLLEFIRTDIDPYQDHDGLDTISRNTSPEAYAALLRARYETADYFAVLQEVLREYPQLWHIMGERLPAAVTVPADLDDTDSGSDSGYSSF